MEKLIDISSYPVAQVLDVLLQDKTTKKNIIWATDTYAEFGEEFTDKVQLDANAILRRTDLIRPRIQKSQEAQASGRTDDFNTVLKTIKAFLIEPFTAEIDNRGFSGRWSANQNEWIIGGSYNG